MEAATDDLRPLKPGERHGRFGLIRRSLEAQTEWFQRHWFAFMVPSTLGLTAIFIYFSIRYGFDWGTIFIGVMAGLGCLALVTRLVFSNYWQPR
jgi:hypothetical protein